VPDAPLILVSLYPIPTDPPRLLKRLERVLLDALVRETPTEPLDDLVMLRLSSTATRCASHPAHRRYASHLSPSVRCSEAPTCL